MAAAAAAAADRPEEERKTGISQYVAPRPSALVIETRPDKERKPATLVDL